MKTWVILCASNNVTEVTMLLVHLDRYKGGEEVPGGLDPFCPPKS